MLTVFVTASTNPLANVPSPDLHLRWLVLAVVSGLIAAGAGAHSRSAYGVRLWWGLGAVVAGTAAVAFLLTWLTKLLGPLFGVIGSGGGVLVLLVAVCLLVGSNRTRR